MNKVKIKFHGNIWDSLKTEWNLCVRSVSEAMNAVETMSRRKLYKQLVRNEQKGIKYRILINERDCLYEEVPTLENPKPLLNSEIVMPIHNLRTIDIVPVAEGGEVFTIVSGILLIAGGVKFGGFVGAALILAGLSLVTAGVINLLSSPPKFEDFREIGGGGRPSYLFSGPQNVTREGGPVPIVYGRLLVGSQVIGASFEISHKSAENASLTT